MAKSIIMPKSGMAMEEGVILRWLKKVGDPVEKGEPVLEVETDKTNMEVEADYDGVLLAILREEGDTVPVTEVIGWIGEPGEKAPEAAAEETPAGTAAPTDKVKATPAARRAAGERGIDICTLVPSGMHGEIRERDVEAAGIGADVFARHGGSATAAPKAAAPAAAGEKGQPKATPLVRKIAEKRGIDLANVQGSGPRGKIFVKDLQEGTAAAGAAAASAGAETRVKLTNIQRVTGKRMLKSHLEIPPVTINTEADVTELLKIRAELNTDEEIRFTINDFVLKAAAKCLAGHPRLNARLDGDELVILAEVHLGVAVATDRGLMVPVVKNAERKSLAALSREMSGLRQKASAGTLTNEEITGSTFTVSNIGKFGITSFTPIINQPEAAILGVCAITEQLRMAGEKIETRRFMGLSLTFDHRICDGADAAAFLQQVKERLEKPLMLLAS